MEKRIEAATKIVKDGRMPTKEEAKKFIVQIEALQKQWKAIHAQIESINGDTNAATHGSAVWYALHMEVFFLRHPDEYERKRAKMRVAAANKKLKSKK